MLIGKQRGGSSSDSIKFMALRSSYSILTDKSKTIEIVADIGCGKGDFAKQLADFNKQLLLVDFDPLDTLPSDKCSFFQADLNHDWPIASNTVDFLFSLEVIEHTENPRHFFREIARVLRPEGYGFVSTPNNESLFSKLVFLFKSQHRYFQDASYPGHITPLLQVDFLRIINENNLIFKGFYYTNQEVIPLLNLPIKGYGKSLSGNFGVLFQKK
jgi:SAM-dependent methyltransferase